MENDIPLKFSEIPKMFHIENGCGLGNTVEFLLIAVSVLPAATKKSLRFAGKLATVNQKTNDSTLLSSLDATPVQKVTHNRMPDASGCVAADSLNQCQNCKQKRNTEQCGHKNRRLSQIFVAIMYAVDKQF